MTYKSFHLELLVLHLLPLLNPSFIVEVYPTQVFSIGNSLLDVHLNWCKWFHPFILEGGLLVIVIDCMIFRFFLDVTRMSRSTVSFLAQQDSGNLCL